MTNDIVIKNGEKMRKWISTLVPVVLLASGGIYAFANLGTTLSGLDIKIDKECDAVRVALKNNELSACNKALVMQEKIKVIEDRGTDLSHANEKKIIRIEADVIYTKEAVKRIEKIVTELAKNQHK